MLINNKNNNSNNIIKSEMSVSQSLSIIAEQLSQCHINQSQAEDTSEMLSHCGNILSEMERIVSICHSLQQQPCDTSIDLSWDSTPDLTALQDVSMSSSLSSSLSYRSSSSNMDPEAEERQLEQEIFVDTMVDLISTVAPGNVFSRRRSKRSKRRRKLMMIQKDLRTMWTHAEELIGPVSSSDVILTTPTVDWSKVNTRFLSNLPTPKLVPKHGCSVDPSFYESYEAMVTDKFYGDSRLVQCPPKHQQEFPFGSEYGVETSAGVIAAKNIRAHGHVWCDTKQNWIVDAQFQPVKQEDRRDKKRDSGGQRGRWKRK